MGNIVNPHWIVRYEPSNLDLQTCICILTISLIISDVIFVTRVYCRYYLYKITLKVVNGKTKLVIELWFPASLPCSCSNVVTSVLLFFFNVAFNFNQDFFPFTFLSFSFLLLYFLVQSIMSFDSRTVFVLHM